MNGRELSPTLWRSCRALANRTRIEILGLLMRHPGTDVGGVAAACGIDVPSASRHLRALQSRGLLAAKPVGPHVVYRAHADPLVPQARRLLTAMEAEIRAARPPAELIRALTAFTHPRRIRIVRALAVASLDIEALRARCRISRPALFRHLAKLHRRGIVARGEDGNYELVGAQIGISECLLRLALA